MYTMLAEQSASQRAAVHHRGGGIPYPPSYLGGQVGQYGAPTPPPMAPSPAPRSITPPFNLIGSSLPGTVSTVGTAPNSTTGYVMGGTALGGSGGSTIGMGSSFFNYPNGNAAVMGNNNTFTNATVSSGFPLDGLPPQLSHTVFSLSNDMPIVVNGGEISPVDLAAPILVEEGELVILGDGEVGVPDALRLAANSIELGMDAPGSVNPQAFEAELREWLRHKGYIGQPTPKPARERGGVSKVTTTERGSPRFGMHFKCTVSDSPDALRVTVDHRGSSKVIPLERVKYASESLGSVSDKPVPLCEFPREEQVGILSNLQGSYNTVKLGEWDTPYPELLIIMQQKGDHRSPRRGGGDLSMEGSSTATLTPKGHRLPSPTLNRSAGSDTIEAVRRDSPVMVAQE